MQAFEIERQTHQTPFSGSGEQAAQRELAEAQDFFDDPDHRFDSALTQAVDGLADLSLKFVGHFDPSLRSGQALWTGIFVWRLRQFSEEVVPTLVVGFPACGNVGLNAAT